MCSNRKPKGHNNSILNSLLWASKEAVGTYRVVTHGSLSLSFHAFRQLN